MKVQTTVVGSTSDVRSIDWPDGWPIPREGEAIEIPGIHDMTPHVRYVVWYPLGEPGEDDSEPFVYIIIGRKLEQ